MSPKIYMSTSPPVASAKPSIFIGSSSEALKMATQIAAILSEDFDVTIWNQHIFQLGETTIEGLTRVVQSFDFALLIFTDDETVSTSRVATKAIRPFWERWLWSLFGNKTNFVAPRDNVVFELGMFYGAKGRRKTFTLVIPSDRGTPKIPSDLGGITLSFAKNPDGGITEDSLRADVSEIREAIITRFKSEADFEMLPSTGSAVGYFLNFVAPVCSALQSEAEFEVEGEKYDLRKGDFEIRIVVPQSLSDANQATAQRYCEAKGLKLISIKTALRPFPFWVQPTIENGKVIFWDYPMALKSSDEAVRYVTQTAYLSSAPIRTAMEGRELRNFEKVISLMLMATSEGAPFKNNVTIHHVNP